jgi:RNA polymerase sigma-70 factor (ECF subfamily)
MDAGAQLERWHREHAAYVHAYVRRRIGPDEADDVVADVFVVAWRRRGDAPSEPRAWLLGIARKALGNRRRTARRQRALFELLAAEAGTGVSAVGAPGELLVPGDGAVLRALATLSAADREVLLLITWDGLSNPEAAQVLGVAPNTVAQRVRRARTRFDRALGRAESVPSRTAADAVVVPVEPDAPSPRSPARTDRQPTGASLLTAHPHSYEDRT